MSGAVTRGAPSSAPFWDRVGHHGLWAGLSGAVIAISALLPASAWPAVPCFFRRVFHRPCPFCGLTRSVRAAAHGDWAEAWHGAPLGPVLFTLLVVYFLWHAAGFLRSRPLRVSAWERRTVRWIVATTVLAVLANWLYRWTMGFDRT